MEVLLKASLGLVSLRQRDSLVQAGETESATVRSAAPQEVHQQKGGRQSHDCGVSIFLVICQCSGPNYTSLEGLHRKDAGSKQSGK